MKREAFTLLHDSEQSWWYRGRALVVRTVLAQLIPSRAQAEALDFGAGYGGMLPLLRTFCSTVFAYEPDKEACGEARTRGYTAVFDSPEEALSRSYALIGLFDVVEHIEDDHRFIRQAQYAVKPGGRIVVTVPAFPFLWSRHDEIHHHFRRYTKRDLVKLLSEAGFEIERISYWNAFLFPIAALMRIAGRAGDSSFALRPAFDAFCYGLIVVESAVLRFCSLPFGLSMVVVARKSRDARLPEVRE